MARFDEIYEKYKKKQKNGIGLTDAETSASGGYKATGRFAGILANYQKNGASFSGVDDSYVQSFFKDAQAYTKKAAEESRNIDWALATDKAKTEERNKTLTDLSNRAKAVKVYLSSNKNRIDQKTYQEYMDFLKNFENAKQNIYDTFLGNTNYYSQFGSQEEVDFHEAHSTPEKRLEWYKGLDTTRKELEAQKAEEEARWQNVEANANSYDGFAYSEMEEAHWNKMRSLDEEIEKIDAEKREYERSGYNDKGQHYGSRDADEAIALMSEKDFSKYSQKKDYKNPTRAELDEADRLADSTTWDYDSNGVLRDANGNVVEKDESGKYVSSKAKDYAIKDKLGLFLSATDQEMEEYQGTIVNGTWGKLIGEGIEGSWDQLTEDEIKVYYYILNKNGQEAADKFLADMKTELNRRTTEAQTTATKEKYNSANAFEKILMNAVTVPSNLLGGFTGLGEDVAHLIRGEEINPYSSSHSFSNFSNTVRSETAKELDELLPGVKIPVVDFTVGDFYQTVMSRFDSLASIAIGGKLGGVLLATGAAANEMGRLYEEGASAKQMILGSLAAGAAEMVFESLSIDKLISMKDAKTKLQWVKNALIQGGIEASEEGLTEIANIISNAAIMGDKSDWNKLVKAHNGDELAAFLEKVQDVAKASLGGFFSGAMGGASTTGVTKLTDNEKAVVNKLVEEELAKPENKGKSKSSIRADIIERLENGDLDIDKIEEILGGEGEYNAIKKEADEFNALYTTESGKLSEQQKDRLAELKKKNQENPYEAAVENAKQKRSQVVYDLVKNDRLAESYNQKAKRSQSFEADLSEYDEAQRATVKNAIDSGILNNTKKTHDFVNMLAKLSADKGVAFDFTSNEKLKNSSFAVEGAVVNGYYNAKANKIGVNVSSAKALNSVVGHEITHVLEGTELYDELQKAVKKYAESKGDYKGRLDSLKKLYKNVKDADISKELTADLVGDYLFTDSDFVNRLSTENRTLFEKIFDEVKYLCRIATAGSKEARELEKVKKIFEDAFRNSGKAVANTSPTADPDIRYSLSETDKSYMDAVSRGDMVTAQKMVDEAAKKAGLSTEHLFHGTPAFGFTTIDTSESDDSISFFATNNPEAAQGYMPWYEDDASDRYHNEPRRIGKDIKQRAITNRSSIEDVVKVLNATFDNEYKNARAATDKETLDSFKVYHIPEMVEAASKLIDRNVPQKIKDLCKLVVEANKKDTFAAWAEVSKRYKEFETAEIPYDPDDWANDILWSRVVVDLQSISKMARTEPILNNGAVIMKSSLIDRYNTFLGGEAIGMYDFYGNNKNQLVIWGEGSNWQSIPLGEHDAEYRKWLKETRGNDVPAGRPVRASTRDISEFAKHMGYRSVVFVDIYDAGAYGERGVLSDVYSYFYPKEDIKSADPVTYDDQGNVIPLSQRFNQSNPDIRYSISKAKESRKNYGDYNVYGEDIGLPGVFEEESAPVKKTKVKAKKSVDSIIAEKKEQLQKAKEELKWIEDHKGSMDLDFEEAATYMQIKKLKEEIESLQSSKSQQKAVGAAESGFNPITHLQYEYGTIPEGEHPVRDDSMPVSTNGKDRVSYSARTVKGAAATPDELVDLLDKETAEGRLSYIPIKNSDTVAKAYDSIVAKGWNEAKGEWSARVRKGETGAEMVATGALLLNNAAKAGDTKAWLDILHDYRMMNTNTAQALQAARILKTLTPDDTLYMMEKSVKQMVEDMKLDKEIVIDEDLATEYIEAEDENAREAVRKKIVKDVARQIPPTAVDRWTALRYLNMLGNVKTQVRNILGNVGMAVTSEIKNTVAASIEAIASKVSGGNFQRTKSVLVNRDQYNAAKDDFASVEQETLNGGKYNDNLSASTQFAQDVMDEREIFGKLVPLEKYRQATNWAMEKGDLVFSRRAYARALAGYLKANGITETDFSKVDPQVMDEARAYAVQEAQENTFRDNNWLSKWASSALRGNKTPKIIKVLGEGLLPFRKTPANVLFRAEEYSPLGILNSTVKSIQLATGKGEVTGADVVNSWAKSLTGTGLFALGMMLSNIGALSGGADDDEEKEWFENLYGLQNYSITIGDYNFTIDFLSPSAMPILMGAQLNELMQDGNIELKELEAALLSLADPMIEMSMLQGLNDALDNIRYAESNMGQFLINSALSYLTQGITNSLVGQLERSFEGKRMTTYVDKDSPLPAWLQKAIGSVSAKIPGLDFQQIPYIDAWGETEDIAPLPGFLENVLSPSYVSQDVTDELFDELNRLNDAQSDYNVYPSTPEKALTFDDADGNHHENYNLSAEEYVELAQLQGKTQKALVEQILASEQYAELTDKEKAKAIRMAYTYAKDASRIEVLNADGFSSKWMGEAGDGIVDAIIAHTNEERTYAYDYPEKYAVSQAITGDFAKYKEYSKYLNNVEADKDANGKPINGSAKEKKVAYIQSLDLDYGQKIILYKSEYKGDDSYDDDIIEYLRGRSDISYEEKMTILKTLGIVE